MGAGQRRKGNTTEIAVSKILCRAAGLSPWREHLPTTRSMAGGTQEQRQGDLIPISEEAKRLFGRFYAIEVKGDRKFSWQSIFRNNGELHIGHPLAYWIRRLRRHGPNGVPELLIILLNGFPAFAIISRHLLNLGGAMVRFYVEPSSGEREYFGVWRISDLVAKLKVSSLDAHG